MKKNIPALIILFICTFSVKAQKGTILVYGNINFSVLKFNGVDKLTNLSLDPSAGYQFSNHWTAGLDIAYLYNRNTYPNYGMNTSSSGYIVGPFVRYSQQLSSLFSVYGQLEIGYGHSKNNQTGGVPVSKTDGLNGSFYPALFINIKNGFGLNFSLGGIEYGGGTATGVPGVYRNFSFNFGQTAILGVSKNFGRLHKS